MQTCIWFQQGTRTCAINVGCDEIAAFPPSPIAEDPPALPSPTSSPPPVSNSSWLHLMPAPVCRLLYCAAVLFRLLCGGCSVTMSCLTLCNPMDCSTPHFPLLHCLLELSETNVHWMGDAIQPSHLLSPPYPPALNLSQHQSFPMSWLFASGIGVYIRNTLCQSIGTSASVLSMNIQSWFPLGLTGLMILLFKGLSSLLQPHSSKVSILWCSIFFLVQLSHAYMTTGETRALTIWNLVGKVMSLVFITLSRIVIAFLPRSKHLNSMAAWHCAIRLKMFS